MDYSPIINGKNILITGGTGSFGRQLVKEISGLSPKNVVIYSRDEDKQYSMKQDLSDEKISKRISFVIGDVRDYERLYSCLLYTSPSPRDRTRSRMPSSA